MSEPALQRIENKLDEVRKDISQIRGFQARDDERLKGFAAQMADIPRQRRTEIQLHAAGCEAKKELGQLADRMDAAANKLKGARWAGGRLWAVLLGAVVVLDVGLKIWAATR